MRSLRERIGELRAAHDAQISGVLERYDGLCRQVDEYHASLEQAMSAGSSARGGGTPAKGRGAAALSKAPMVR
jgi:hypothetical protein